MKLKNILFVFIFLGTLMSCGDDLAELNIDPNTSPTARPQEVLTAGQVEYANVLEAFMNENSSVFAQYWAGGPGVAILDHERYFFEPADFNAYFSRSYRQALSDLSFVIKNGNPDQKAIAEIMSVSIYQILVDLFGDIPYSESLKGAPEDGAIVSPKYDAAKDVYKDLILRLDNAVSTINGNGGVGSEDQVYGGDMNKWVLFSNSLKLKLLVRQSVTDNTVGQAIKDHVAKGGFITTANDMPKVDFAGVTGGWNPQYARRESGIKQFYVASNTFVKKLNSLNDPRLSALFNVAVKPKVIVGLDQGNINDVGAVSKDDYSFPSSVQYDKANDVILMSPWEVFFLRAEADARFETSDDKIDMLNQALSSHFTYIGSGSSTEYAASLNLSSLSNTAFIDVIGVQKWISMCGLQETEGWIESRRFDTPNSPIFTKGIFATPTRTVLGQGVFPSICLYPASELSFNPNCPKGRKITDKVFWDN